MAARSKAPTMLAVAAVGGVGYYMYSARGNPKTAAKKAKSAFLAAPYNRECLLRHDLRN